MDSTLKGGNMNEYVSSLLSCRHRVRGISATREDEKGRVNVSVAHSSNSPHVETHIQLPFEHLVTIQNWALLMMLSHLFSCKTYVGK